MRFIEIMELAADEPDGGVVEREGRGWLGAPRLVERVRQLSSDVLEIFAGLEADRTARRDPDLFPRPRIPADAALARLHLEHTEPAELDSLAALGNLPIGNGAAAGGSTLGGLASFQRATGPALISQYDVQTMVQIHATTQDRDLGAVANDIRRVLAQTRAEVPKGSNVQLLGQVRTMDRAFSGLLFGLLGAVVLIYLLIVVNFQSWLDPAVIVSALPAALAGIVWMLFATGTTLSVPALTGAIMCMGVATANSVLVISFARERLEVLGDATAAALEAGFVRFRPVLMTALAMVIGMLPMALGLGEGGEQNAPLGRAVIGGLIFATFAIPDEYPEKHT